jgi:phosphoenolpyruvate carboxykinase (ATP)
MLSAALSGELQEADMTPHPVFRLRVPHACPGVPPELLEPRGLWPDPAAYDRAAHDLARRFNQNFEKFTHVSREIAEAAPAA